MKLFAIVLLAATVATAQTAHYRHHGKTALPDAKATPGAINPNAVADLSGKHHIVTLNVRGKKTDIEENVCADDFRTGPIRTTISNFAELKKKTCDLYGVDKCDGSVEGDHFISIEIGGCPDCLTNIWPQPMDEARVKDHQVEDVLPKLVCSGKMTLKQAQQCVTDDWVACGAKIAKMTQ